MNPVIDAIFSSWPSEPVLLIALLLTAIIYLRGWCALRGRDNKHWHRGQPTAFLGGLAAIFLALASPIETFSSLLLRVHMVQHLLLMMVAPPLIWLGAPLFPMLKGLPVPIRKYWVAPLFRSAGLRRFFRGLLHPISAWMLYVAATWIWHFPVLYEMAVRSDSWHYAQHLTFLATGLLFWFPVVRPYPARPRWSRWLLVPYLILADVQNTVLAALLTFSDRVLYPFYERMPRLDGFTVLDDQAAAGVLMWVPGSIAYLLPLFGIVIHLMFGTGMESHPAKTRVPGRISLPLISTGPDLLRVPLLGRFLRWRYARLCMQIPVLMLAGLLIYDGLTGPDVAPMNLAGVLPWVHWRGLLIIGLLVVGNVFCMACPFMAPRMLARRLFPQPFAWPRRLRNKWLAILLLGLFLWAYEAFALWDSPWWTAWIAVGYFAAALVVDGLFRGAAFCKYVCPIGQFNFVQSLLSPWEVKARDPAICTKCETKDCIRGNSESRGCELDLFVPRKSSNLDCTLCLDCIHACPHDNIGIIADAPGRELWHDPRRSGVGRFSQRRDLAALVLLLVFGAFANAAGMIAPVTEMQERLRIEWGGAGSIWIVSIYYLLALVVIPILFVGTAAILSRWWGSLPTSTLATATRYVYCLAPLGFAMWLSHYSFHLLTGYDVVLPVLQRFAADSGVNLGSPQWAAACCRPVMHWIPRLEIFFLDLGLLLSLYTGYRIALASAADQSRALRALAPWAILILILFALGVWIVLQPMQMRGLMEMAG